MKAAATSVRRERTLDAVVSYSLLALSALFALFPVAWMLSTSLKSEAEAFALPVRWIPQRATVQAYVEMWTMKPFATYFYNSTVVSGLTALLSTALGALAGYGFSRFRFRFRTALLGGFLATQMISGVLVIGPYFQILAAVELYNTLTGLIIAYVTICLPFAAWMSKGYFDSIPKELDEAGLVDGASRLQIFLRIIMPIAVPGTVATLLFGFLLAWQDLLWALCLISIDEKRTVTLGVAFTVGEFIVKWPMLTAASLIGSLPTIILYLFLQRFYVEGLARGAVKG
ncbi:MAG: carbohydrate ABC transporter permease [candidate division NC10 bacterium]|nr:carbohydrate ABC transporter permease [candidate division NC10 bacterium]MBI2455261.1 carbohydrate ABC transporter permease [candidate division NC10 bacterium]